MRILHVLAVLALGTAPLAAVAATPILPPDAPATARIVHVPRAGTSFAEWDVVTPHGREHRVAISRDGGATWSPSDPMDYGIPLRAGLLDPGVASPALSADLASPPGNRLFIVQLRTKGLEAWRRALADAGVELLWYLPRNAWIARMEPAAASGIARLPFVRWVGAYAPGYKLDPDVVAAIRAARASELPRRYHLATFAAGPVEKALLAAEVRAIGGEVVQETANGYLLDALLGHDQVLAIARSSHLAWLDAWGPPGNDMNVVREQDGANYVESVAGYSGQGVRGEVMDCGIMPAHQDHDGMIVHGPAASTCDHGTCTYGIVFGNGNRDGDGDAAATGNIPSAQGFFFDYNNLVDRYQETAELLQSPYFAVFQSNSWGDALTSSYNSISQQMDDIIFQNDIAIFQSQSNNGNTASRPQAWAKNIISIGAIQHFDTPTLADDCWCNGASIGPAADGRIKPDLSFWYDDIYTTDLEPGGYSSGLYTPTFGGTSAATPITAGISGLFFQMWADNILGNNPAGSSVFEKRPHAMTLKALMINTADQYSFSGTGVDLTRVHQGWGLASARNFYDRRAKIKVVNEENVLEELGVHSYSASVGAGEPFLKITLAYMDRAGTTSSSLHRINDVSLKVVDPAGTATYYGNVGLDAGNWSVAGGSANHLDTIENVFVQNPSSGSWTIEVSADDINMDEHLETPEVDQDYALVVSGANDLVFGCAVRPPGPAGLDAAPNGDNRIDLSWTADPAATGYRVYRSSVCGGVKTQIAQLPSSQTTFSDTSASGGSSYAYVVTSLGDCESLSSNCATATASGFCLLAPSFAGVGAVTSSDTSSCGIDVTWAAGTPACGGPLVYNVFRGTTQSFTPSAANRVGSCVAGTTFHDERALGSHATYWYVVRAEDTGGRGGTCNGSSESNGVAKSAVVKGPLESLAFYDFESGFQGWTPAKGVPPGTAGDWVNGTPSPTILGGQPAQPGNCGTGAKCLFTGVNPPAASGNGDVDGGEVMVTSPAIDASAFGTVHLSLQRWHFNNTATFDAGDHYVLELSNDAGATWANLETLGPQQTVNAWTSVGFDLETKKPLTAQMKLRARTADGTANDTVVESAIDAVALDGTRLCTTVASGAPGGVPASSLTVDRDGSKIRLSWGEDCGGRTGFGIYRGDLAAGYASAAPLAGYCGVGGTSISIDPDTGSYFFLVAPNDGAVEGSLGRTSDGTTRPQPAAACWPRAGAVNACAP